MRTYLFMCWRRYRVRYVMFVWSGKKETSDFCPTSVHVCVLLTRNVGDTCSLNKLSSFGAADVNIVLGVKVRLWQQGPHSVFLVATQTPAFTVSKILYLLRFASQNLHRSSSQVSILSKYRKTGLTYHRVLKATSRPAVHVTSCMNLRSSTYSIINK